MFLARAPHVFARCLQRAWYSVQVVVPPMGDSITEGSIAAVLKSAGDSVMENEVIAQIETDKVTIDIKAPTDGRLIGILVKEQDTVIPGQLVATVDDTVTASNLIRADPPQATATTVAPPSPSAPEAPPPPAHLPGRIPLISFPPRVTPDGLRISSLSVAEAVDWTQRLSTAPAAPAGSAAPPTAVTAAAAPRASAAPAVAGTPTTSSSSKASSTWLGEQPCRRELTDEEMEIIMLGGASP